MADGGSHNGPSDGLRGRDLASVGGMVAGSVIGFMVLGILLDRAAGTSPVFSLVGLALGIIGGCVGFWLRVRSALRDPGSS
jgi:F0F1-type ATP synthase assembly protein I